MDRETNRRMDELYAEIERLYEDHEALHRQMVDRFAALENEVYREALRLLGNAADAPPNEGPPKPAGKRGGRKKG